MLFKMFQKSFFFLLTLFLLSKAEDVIIIGAGASGMAAAINLLDHNIKNIIVLEAEDRIGGRIHSVKLGDGYVDLGAEYVHGLNGSVVYDMAKDLVDSESYLDFDMYLSDGTEVDKNLSKTLTDFTTNTLEEDFSAEGEGISLGELLLKRYNSTILSQYKDNPKNLAIAKDYIPLLESATCCSEGCFDWFQPAALEHYEALEGNLVTNWKGLGYATVFGLLDKRLNQEVKENFYKKKLLINKEVNKIDWHNDDKVKVFCKDGTSYEAKHVIVTASVGVLRKFHQTLFEPNFPSKKKQVLDTIGFSGVMKIALHFPTHWWGTDQQNLLFVWKEEDIKNLNKENQWIKHIFRLAQAPNNPTVLIAWVIGHELYEVEKLSKESLRDGIMLALNTFLKKSYKVEEPTDLLWSTWVTNEHFLGTYSYDTVASVDNESQLKLQQPLSNTKNVPLVLFAGEATHPERYGTVHGAIETGFRESDKLIKLLS